MSKRFKHKNPPKTVADFEVFMKAVDKWLAQDGLTPAQRPFHVPRLLFEAFGASVTLSPNMTLLQSAGYEGDILLAKAHAWFQSVYGSRAVFSGSIAGAPLKLAQDIWRVKVPHSTGTVQFFVDRDLSNKGVSVGNRLNPPTVNILRFVEELPPGLAQRLSDKEVVRISDFFRLTTNALRWSQRLPAEPLFNIAKQNYESATAELIARRYPESSWASQQSVEKFIKAFHAYAYVPYINSGPKGHDLETLGKDFKEKFGIELPEVTLTSANWSPDGRYKEGTATEESALEASHAVLDLLQFLSSTNVLAVAETLRNSH